VPYISSFAAYIGLTMIQRFGRHRFCLLNFAAKIKCSRPDQSEH
jgi:hypothetical protein